VIEIKAEVKRAIELELALAEMVTVVGKEAVITNSAANSKWHRNFTDRVGLQEYNNAFNCLRQNPRRYITQFTLECVLAA
jgi:hypothetical protein